MNKLRLIIPFMKKEAVLLIALLLAIVSAFLVHPDKQYIGYIDYRTLAILLSLMLTMAGLQSVGVFELIGERLVGRAKSIRGIAFILVFLCFVFSMIITNDVALITFVPFTIVTLTIAKRQDLLIPVIVLQTIAANLGSMTTPIGNPQNLYLYSLSGMKLPEFLLLMLPYSALAAIGLALCILIKVKGASAPEVEKHEYLKSTRQKLLVVLYMVCFVVSLLVVARVLEYYIGLAIVVVLLLILDRKVFLSVDYSLLFTFVFLFIFIGNMKRMPWLAEQLAILVAKNEVLVSAALSQVISNVPAAILCSGFTDQIDKLIVGTNLGGLGTIIASMASLISFKLYCVSEGADKGKYIRVFTVYNVVFLIASGALAFVILHIIR